MLNLENYNNIIKLFAEKLHGYPISSITFEYKKSASPTHRIFNKFKLRTMTQSINDSSWSRLILIGNKNNFFKEDKTLENTIIRSIEILIRSDIIFLSPPINEDYLPYNIFNSNIYAKVYKKYNEYLEKWKFDDSGAVCISSTEHNKFLTKKERHEIDKTSSFLHSWQNVSTDLPF